MYNLLQSMQCIQFQDQTSNLMLHYIPGTCHFLGVREVLVSMAGVSGCMFEWLRVGNYEHVYNGNKLVTRVKF